MLEVKFYEEAEDEKLKFAVIISRDTQSGKWVFCKHRERDTYEIPGGHREAGETILETAKRELQEEAGAVEFEIEQIGIYSVAGKNRVNAEGEETFGMLYFAEISAYHELHSEIERVDFLEAMPENLTYPEIQPKLMEYFLERKGVKSC